MKTCPYNIQRFLELKKMKISVEFFYIFLIFAQDLECGYKLEPPYGGGSNEYPHSTFWSKNKKNRHTPAYLVLLYKSGMLGVFIARICFP